MSTLSNDWYERWRNPETPELAKRQEEIFRGMMKANPAVVQELRAQEARAALRRVLARHHARTEVFVVPSTRHPCSRQGIMQSAQKRAKRVIPEDHPAWQAALKAPLEPESEEQRLAVEEAMRSGKVISGVEVTAEIARRGRAG